MHCRDDSRVPAIIEHDSPSKEGLGPCHQDQPILPRLGHCSCHRCGTQFPRPRPFGSGLPHPALSVANSNTVGVVPTERRLWQVALQSQNRDRFAERIPRNRPSPWLLVLVPVCTPGDQGVRLRRSVPLYTTWNSCNNDTYTVCFLGSLFRRGSVCVLGRGVFQSRLR
jgi:hypothetical protein